MLSQYTLVDMFGVDVLGQKPTDETQLRVSARCVVITGRSTLTPPEAGGVTRTLDTNSVRQIEK